MKDWFTALPKNWKVARLCDHAEVVNGYPFDSDLFHTTQGMPLVRIRDISEQTTEVRFAGEPVAEAVIRRGDILVGMDGDFNVARWRGDDALLNQRVCCVRPRITLNASFISYLLPLPLKIINDLTYSTTVKHLSSLEVLKIRFPLPSSDEQRAIAAFLDQETTRLDALVAAKERWLELLAEKRRAIITRAVTRGLNPTAPLRDSGLSWLGQIPAHWELKKLKFTAEISYGVGDELDRSLTSGVPLISLPNVAVDGSLNLNEVGWATISDADKQAMLLTRGDLLFNWRNGSSQHVGKTAYFDAEGEYTHVGFLLRIRFDLSRHDSRFFQYYLNTLRATGFFLYTRAMVNNTFNQTELENLDAPVPTFEEQRAIVAYISAETAKLDALRLGTERTIDLLKERRAALIAAAVTGELTVK